MTSLDAGPELQRPRRLAWGDATSRDVMAGIADRLRRATGFGACAIEVVRSDAMLEFVALVTDDPEIKIEHDGASGPLAVMTPALERGTVVGSLRFVRADEMPREELDRILAQGIVLTSEVSQDPRCWHPEDLLVVEVRDTGGRLRALTYLDLPRDGLRPSVEHLTALEERCRPVVQAVLVHVEREEYAQQIKLANATRAVLRAASPQAGLDELAAIVRQQCREPFHARGVWFGTLEDFDAPINHPPGVLDNPDVPADIRVAMKLATGRAWHQQSVIIIEADRVWGDDEIDREFRAELTPHVADRGLRSVVLVPIGAGTEPVGLLAIARDLEAPRWTEDESAAALDVAHDLGRAVLNARANDRERAAVAELRQVGDYRRTLIESVARELQSPLALVTGHLEILGEMDLPAAATASLTAMIRNTARLSGLAQDLALVSRLADSTVPPSLASLDLASLVAEAVEALRPQMEHRGVTIEVSSNGDCSVQGHPLELSRCIGGLLDNAVKFSHVGGQVHVTVSAEAHDVVLTVRDQGIGISSKDQAQLFGEFFRADDPAALSRSGYGLGLSIVRQVVLRHSGSVTVDSVRGQGSTFRVQLPRFGDAVLETTW